MEPGVASYLKNAGDNIVIQEGSSGDSVSKQSPIDICYKKVISAADALHPIVYHYSEDPDVTLVNNGYAPTWNVSPGLHYVTGGPSASAEYELLQFHIHYSSDRSQGSEHTINGKAYPAEIHFVHYKREYGTAAEAMKKSDGLMVLGFFLDIDNAFYHPELDTALQQLSGVKQNGATAKVSLSLDKYNMDSDRYFNYEGSLTTPGYDECVAWINMLQPLHISNEGLGHMQALESKKGGLVIDHGNYRGLQALNGREVRANFDVEVSRGVRL